MDVFHDRRLPSVCREVYFDRVDGRPGIILAADADEQEARELLAHGIAHHLLHTGNRVSGCGTRLWSARHEREADDFAAHLLVPEARLLDELRAIDVRPVADIAAVLDVSEALLKRRLQLLGEQQTRILTVT